MFKKNLICFVVIFLTFSVFADDVDSFTSVKKRIEDEVLPDDGLIEIEDNPLTVNEALALMIPHYYKVQYAGLIGFMSIGVGYTVKNIYEPVFMLGYLDPYFGNSDVTVTSFAWKNNFVLFGSISPDYLKFYAGTSVLWCYTNGTFGKLPPHYPDDYYFQNRVHLAPHMGLEYKKIFSSGFAKAGGIFMEIGTFDNYIKSGFTNDYVKFYDIWNLAFGLTVYIK
ncbi:MAG TPA: hypothetical protein P5123_09120 [Spirochaetota bacterium]|nr:hypothetical protein [Spirochaetota bacterium]